MSYSTWHNYGYGICTDDIEVESVERLEALLARAPDFRREIHEWMAENEIDDPTVEDYYEYDDDGHYELATILRGVIKEAIGIELCSCDDCECKNYLIYMPDYPWCHNDIDKSLNEEKLQAVFREFVAIVTGDKPIIEYQSVENGG